MKKTYINKWFNLDFNGTIRFAQCIDVEFGYLGLGPLMLMQTRYGNKFWLTRKEFKEQSMNKCDIDTRTRVFIK